MKIVRQDISVVPDVTSENVLIFLGGMRISLSSEEAKGLSDDLDGAVVALKRASGPVAIAAATTTPPPAPEPAKPVEVAVQTASRVFAGSRPSGDSRPAGFRPLG
jgi:hypothetical protein